MTLTSLIPAAANSSTQSASAQPGYASAPESAVPSLGDVTEFAVRLKALFAQAASSAAENGSTAASVPSHSSLVLEEATASTLVTPDGAVPLAATVNLPRKAAAISTHASPAHKAHTAHLGHTSSQDGSTAAQRSHQPLTSQAHEAALSAEYAPTFPDGVPVTATMAPQPAPLPITIDRPVETLAGSSSFAPVPGVAEGPGRHAYDSALPFSSFPDASAADSSASAATHDAHPFAKSNDLYPNSQLADAAVFADVSSRGNLDSMRDVAAGTPATPAPEPSETSRRASFPAVHPAVSQVSGPSPRPHGFPADSSGEPAAFRGGQFSDSAVQSAPHPVARQLSFMSAPPNRYPAAAADPNAAAHGVPLATAAVPQHQAPPSDTGTANRASIAASQPSTPEAAVPSAVQAATAESASLQAATAHSAAATNSKSQPAAFRAAASLGDPSSITNMFPAAASGLPSAETRSTQPAPQVGTGSLFSQSTFAALDAATQPPSTVFTHAGARHAEAGYLDPSLGWVGVRAEVSGGALHAAVVPASSQAADVLGAHLPALHAYVSQQHGLESTIDMSWQHDANTGSGFQQSSQQDRHSSAGEDAKGSIPGSPPASAAQPSFLVSFDAAGASSLASGGRYISVLA